MENSVLLPGSVRPADLKGKHHDEILDWLKARVRSLYAMREEAIGPELMRELERVVVLRTVDSKWMDHLDAMDDLRQGIGLRAFGQKDPLTEYKFEAYDMFNNMTESIQEEVARLIMRVRLASPPSAVQWRWPTPRPQAAAPARGRSAARKSGPQ